MCLEYIISIILGGALVIAGFSCGYFLAMKALRKGALITDNIYHDKAPFDEELENTEPLPSHVDGVSYDEEIEEE